MSELCHLYYPGQYGGRAVTHLSANQRISWERPGAVKRVPVEHRAALCRDGFLEAVPIAELTARHGQPPEVIADLAAELGVPVEQYKPAEADAYPVVVLAPRLLIRLEETPAPTTPKTKAARGRKE